MLIELFNGRSKLLRLNALPPVNTTVPPGSGDGARLAQEGDVSIFSKANALLRDAGLDELGEEYNRGNAVIVDEVAERLKADLAALFKRQFSKVGEETSEERVSEEKRQLLLASYQKAEMAIDGWLNVLHNTLEIEKIEDVSDEGAGTLLKELSTAYFAGVETITQVPASEQSAPSVAPQPAKALAAQANAMLEREKLSILLESELKDAPMISVVNMFATRLKYGLSALYEEEMRQISAEFEELKRLEVVPIIQPPIRAAYDQSVNEITQLQTKKSAEISQIPDDASEETLRGILVEFFIKYSTEKMKILQAIEGQTGRWKTVEKKFRALRQQNYLTPEQTGQIFSDLRAAFTARGLREVRASILNFLWSRYVGSLPTNTTDGETMSVLKAQAEAVKRGKGANFGNEFDLVIKMIASSSPASGTPASTGVASPSDPRQAGARLAADVAKGSEISGNLDFTAPVASASLADKQFIEKFKNPIVAALALWAKSEGVNENTLINSLEKIDLPVVAVEVIANIWKGPFDLEYRNALHRLTQAGNAEGLANLNKGYEAIGSKVRSEINKADTANQSPDKATRENKEVYLDSLNAIDGYYKTATNYMNTVERETQKSGSSETSGGTPAKVGARLSAAADAGTIPATPVRNLQSPDIGEMFVLSVRREEALLRTLRIIRRDMNENPAIQSAIDAITADVHRKVTLPALMLALESLDQRLETVNPLAGSDIRKEMAELALEDETTERVIDPKSDLARQILVSNKTGFQSEAPVISEAILSAVSDPELARLLADARYPGLYAGLLPKYQSIFLFPSPGNSPEIRASAAALRRILLKRHSRYSSVALEGKLLKVLAGPHLGMVKMSAILGGDYINGLIATLSGFLTLKNELSGATMLPDNIKKIVTLAQLKLLYLLTSLDEVSVPHNSVIDRERNGLLKRAHNPNMELLFLDKYLERLVVLATEDEKEIQPEFRSKSLQDLTAIAQQVHEAVQNLSGARLADIDELFKALDPMDHNNVRVAKVKRIVEALENQPRFEPTRAHLEALVAVLDNWKSDDNTSWRIAVLAIPQVLKNNPELLTALIMASKDLKSTPKTLEWLAFSVTYILRNNPGFLTVLFKAMDDPQNSENTVGIISSVITYATRGSQQFLTELIKALNTVPNLSDVTRDQITSIIDTAIQNDRTLKYVSGALALRSSEPSAGGRLAGREADLALVRNSAQGRSLAPVVSVSELFKSVTTRQLAQLEASKPGTLRQIGDALSTQLGKPLSDFFVRTALAQGLNASSLPDGGQISLLLENGLNVFSFKLETRGGKNVLVVSATGLEPSILPVQNIQKDAEGVVTSATVSTADLITLTRQWEAAINGELELAQIDTQVPVLIRLYLSLFPDFDKDPRQFNLAVASAANEANWSVQHHQGALKIKLVSSDGKILALTDERLADMRNAYPNLNIGTVFVAEDALPGFKVIDVAPPVQIIPGAALQVAANSLEAGDVGVLPIRFIKNTAQAGIPEARKTGKGLDANYLAGARLATGNPDLTSGQWMDLTLGDANIAERVKNALKPLMKVFENFTQWSRMRLATLTAA